VRDGMLDGCKGRESDRSNSKARSLARMPGPKPVTYRVDPPRLLIAEEYPKDNRKNQSLTVFAARKPHES
jgi:hypothetical protein